MITLSTPELVRVVSRALREVVAPEVAGDFARVQLAAALVALDEVVARLEEGDPIEGENDRLAGLLDQLAGRPGVPGARGVPAVPDRVGLEPRAWNRMVREALWGALEAADPGTREPVLSGLAELESATAMADARWVCEEALASLGG